MNAVIHPATDPLELADEASADAVTRTPSLDALARSLGQVRAQAGPAAHELAAGARHLAQENLDAVRQQAVRLGDRSAGYIRDHPLQSVLIAAGTGAALALMVRALTRSH